MRVPRFFRDETEGGLSRGVEIGIVVLLTVLALCLRVWNLNDLPYGLHGDEANVTIDAKRIIKDGWVGPWSQLSLGYPIAVNYFIAAFIKALDPSPFAVRLPIALIGTAAIPLAYYVGRNIGGWRVGLCGALLLATSLWHLHLSRMGVPVIAWPTGELLTILLLQLGLKSRQPFYFVAAGLTIGVLLWVYPSTFIFAAAVAVYLSGWMLWEIIKRRDWRTAQAFVLLVILAASTFFAAKPMIDFYRQPDTPYDTRVDQVMLFSDERKRSCAALTPDQLAGNQVCRWALAEGFRDRADVVWEKTKLLYRSLVTITIADGIDGLGAKPPLGKYIAYLAGVGAVVALLRYRRDGVLIGFMVVPLLAMATAITVDGQYRRSFGALPFLTLYAGIALGSAWEYAARKDRWGHAGNLAVGALAALTIGLAGRDHVQFYFREFPETPAAKFVFNPEAREAFEYIDSLGAPYVYYYNSRISLSYETREVLAPDFAGGENRSLEFTGDEDRSNIRFDLAPSERPVFPLTRVPDGAVFVFLGPYVEYLDSIRARYPGGEVSERQNPTFGGWDYRAYYLPGDLLDSYLRAEAVEYRVAPPTP
jgi:hypothetical protein